MKPAHIRQAIAAQGLNLRIVAQALEVSPVSVGNVINRRQTSFRIAEAIAKIINSPLFEVFPEYQYVSPRVNPKEGEACQKIAEVRKIIAQI